MIAKLESVANELYCGTIHKNAGDVHTFKFAVGSRDQLSNWAYLYGGKWKLIEQKKISDWPKSMAKTLAAHYIKSERNNVDDPTEFGYIDFFIRKKGGKAIAYADTYVPKSYLRIQREPEDGTKSGGVKAALLEAECLEKLKVAGVTHMTTSTDPNSKRCNQLIARGIKPFKTYPIDEWILKLRSKPDYSKITAMTELMLFLARGRSFFLR